MACCEINCAGGIAVFFAKTRGVVIVPFETNRYFSVGGAAGCAGDGRTLSRLSSGDNIFFGSVSGTIRACESKKNKCTKTIEDHLFTDMAFGFGENHILALRYFLSNRGKAWDNHLCDSS